MVLEMDAAKLGWARESHMAQRGAVGGQGKLLSVNQNSKNYQFCNLGVLYIEATQMPSWHLRTVTEDIKNA